MLRKTGRILLGIIGMLVLVVLGLYLFVTTGLSGPLPSVEELKHAHRPIASRVLAADSSVLGTIYTENRSVVSLDHIPQFLVDALIATEDVRFYRHKGVDVRSLFRVVVKGLFTSAGGGSTLSQQLTKNLFPRKKYMILSTAVHKIREIIVSRRLERVLSKEEILELYLNTVSFGELTHGINTASQRFFNVSPKDLKPEEAATLVGMLKAPTYYSPRRAPERALLRRNVVLSQMAKYGLVTIEFSDSLKALPLETDYTPDRRPSELSRYILTHVEKLAYQILNQHQGSDKLFNPKTDGLTIYTTVDPKIQKHAELAVERQMPRIQRAFDRDWGSRAEWETDAWIESELEKIRAGVPDPGEQSEMTVFSWDEESRVRKMSIQDSLRYYKRILQAGLFAMDPETGHIKAWVGGIDHRYFPYDHVLARRQAGSTFKPFLYAAAMEAGAELCNYYDNTKSVFSEYDDWSPHNANREYGGSYSLQGALVHSVNTVAAKLINEVGISETIEMAKRLGIESHIPGVPSIALGTAELRLDELTKAYAVFANGGYRADPVCILKIEDRFGNVLYAYEPETEGRKQILADSIALKMLTTLQMVVDSGTARGLRSAFGLTLPLAGKTGTTQRYTDGWFVGISPGLVTGTWVGADDPVAHFKTGAGAGGNTAMSVYGAFLRGLMSEKAYSARVRTVNEPATSSLGVPLCPFYSDLTAEEMEAFLEEEAEQKNWTIAEFFDTLFGPKDEDPRQKEQRILKHMQERLDRTSVRLRKQGKSPMEISRRLEEIRVNYYDRIRELREKDSAQQ